MNVTNCSSPVRTAQSTSVHSASEALVTMRYINWCFTYLLTYLLTYSVECAYNYGTQYSAEHFQ